MNTLSGLDQLRLKTLRKIRRFTQLGLEPITSAVTQKRAITKVITWLNQQYPHLQVVMYDIGARHGIHYYYKDLLKLSHFKVVGFEPDEQVIEGLKNPTNSGINQIWPLAIAESKGKRDIFITKQPGCSSLYQPNQALIDEYPTSDYFHIADTQSISTISLDEFTQEFEVVKPDFLKMDIQGAEYEVIKGGESTLTNVIGIFLEAHLKEIYQGEGLFPDIHYTLIKLGFRLFLLEKNPGYAGEVVEIDVAYVKDINLLETEEEVAKAILFCVIHRNLPFAAHIVRNSHLSDSKKIQILQMLSQPINSPKVEADAQPLAVNYGI